MVELRPLIVVTGSIHVEGGETNTVSNNAGRPGRATATITVKRTVSDDRRKANVITADYSRRLKRLDGFVLRTPYGTLVEPAALQSLKDLLVDMSRKIAVHNTGAGACTIANCVVWENLRGNRQSQVAGWISAKKAVPAVKAALPRLLEAEAARAA